jgi:ABC-2 type transport system ATP-binding protein
MNPTLSVKKLKKVYSGKPPFTAVDEISFDIMPGEILGLLGANGSGKTTTIQMLLGTLTHTSGLISYFGKNFADNRSEILQDIAFASTYNSLPYILTIEENLEIFGRFYGLSPKETTKRTDPLLEQFGIIDKKKSRVSGLSAGQITRLMLVKAFFTQPKIVLLDEPTASLDPDVAQEVCKFLSEQRDKTGLSILFTSHKMEEVADLCDRAIFLNKGVIIADDLPKNLAKSVSKHKLSLSIIDGLKRTIQLLETNKLTYQLDLRSIEISLEGFEVPGFLHALMQEGVTYSQIRIQEPTLEDYFLKLVGDSK